MGGEEVGGLGVRMMWVGSLLPLSSLPLSPLWGSVGRLTPLRTLLLPSPLLSSPGCTWRETKRGTLGHLIDCDISNWSCGSSVNDWESEFVFTMCNNCLNHLLLFICTLHYSYFTLFMHYFLSISNILIFFILYLNILKTPSWNSTSNFVVCSLTTTIKASDSHSETPRLRWALNWIKLRKQIFVAFFFFTAYLVLSCYKPFYTNLGEVGKPSMTS